jgi:hypothetical protein
MANISPTVEIDISMKLGIIEETAIGTTYSLEKIISYKSLFQDYRDIFSLSYTDIPNLDPSIVEHCIDTWLDVSPIHQKKIPLHPSKATAIKAKIDKLCIVGFIYPIVYTSWVSNPIPINKK